MVRIKKHQWFGWFWARAVPGAPRATLKSEVWNDGVFYGNPLEWWELDRGNHPKSSPLYHIFSYIICIYISYSTYFRWVNWYDPADAFLGFFATKNSRTHQLWFAVRYWCCLSSSRYCCCLSFWAFLSAARIFYWMNKRWDEIYPEIVLVTMRHGTEWD